jgi:hypothetical protein
MVDQVMQELTPKHTTNRQLPAIEEGHGVFELIVREALQPRHRLLVDAAIPWSEQLDLARPFEIRRIILEAEPPQSDSEAQARVDFAQVPRHLPDRAALRVGAEVVLIRRECFQKSQRVLGLGIPGCVEGLDLVEVSHGILRVSGRIRLA